VAIRAANFALLQLVNQSLTTAPAADKRCDIHGFGAKVVKLQHEYVGDAAVDTFRTV
jgi:hypothetical protein